MVYKRLYSLFEQSSVAILISFFQFLIFWVGIATEGDFPVIQLYGITVVIAALYFGNAGVINTTVVASILISLDLYLSKSTNITANLIGLGMFCFLVLFSNSLSRIKINLDLKSKSLEIKSNVLNMHAAQLKIINELGHKLVSSTAVEDVAELALKATTKLLKLSKASVIIYSNDKKENYIVHFGFDNLQNAGDLLVDFWQKNYKKIIKTKEYFIDFKNTDIALKYGVGVPVESEGEIVGCIVGYSKSSRKFSSNEIAFLSILAEEVGIAVRNSRLHDSLTKRALMLESLVNVSKTLSSPFRLDKIYHKLSELTAAAIGAEVCYVMVSEPSLRTIRIAASNISPADEGRYLSISEDSPIYKAMHSMKAVSANGLKDRIILDIARPDVKSFLVTPIIFEGQAIGVIYLDSASDFKFGPQDKVLARAIADQAALLINRARVYEELKEIAKRSAILAQAGALLITNISLDSRLKVLLQKLKETLYVSKGLIILNDKDVDGGTYVVSEDEISLEGLSREDFEKLKEKSVKKGSVIFESKRGKQNNIILDILKTDKLLAIPIIYQDFCLGIAIFFEPSKNRDFNSRQISLVRLIADYSAVSIHTARLYAKIDTLRAESEERANNLKTLLDVAQTISSSLNTKTVLSRTISLVKKMFDAEAAVLMLHDQYTGDLITKINVGMTDAEIKDLRIKPPNEFIGSVFASRKASKLTYESKNKHDSFMTYHKGKLRSAAAAPLLTRGREIGVISLYSRKDKAFDVNDLELLSIFASQVALSIDTASIYEKEHQLVETLQRSLLPATPSLEGVEIGVLYSPAHIQNEIGGDYYDFITLEPGIYGVVIGDVCGKGIDAATETAMARYYLQAFASKYRDPAIVLSHVNETIANKPECQLITMIYLVIDINKNEIKYANAGHPPAYLVSDSLKAKELNATGPIVGAIPGAGYTSRKLKINKGDFIFLYTDGLIEVQKNGELFGCDRLFACLENIDELPMENLVHNIFMKVMEWGKNTINDDVACVSLKVK